MLNADGASATLTLSQSGQIDLGNPFFQAFGNGRSCASCHQADAGWSITPDSLAARFAATDGLDPVFRLVDGATSPQAPVGTVEARLQAYNLLLQRGPATTDPGAALQSGKWNDIGKMKVPSLRGIESRSPYFHDGSENDVAEIARFYDRRFQIGLSEDEIRDLAAFLKVLRARAGPTMRGPPVTPTGFGEAIHDRAVRGTLAGTLRAAGRRTCRAGRRRALGGLPAGPQ